MPEESQRSKSDTSEDIQPKTIPGAQVGGDKKTNEPSRIFGIPPQAMATISALFILTFIIGGTLYISGLIVGTPSPAPNYAGVSIETEFNGDVFNTLKDDPFLASGVVTEEWPAARSLHKVLAYTIARCRSISVPSMSRHQFNALLLDLRPNGSHSWVNEKGNPQKLNDDQAGLDKLEPFDQTILALSDSVSRARLAAARGADRFFPDMIRFGWAAVIISALATMFVTLKASISPNPTPEQGTFGWHWQKFWIFTFGFLAIGLSTTTTILASAKQFWDPTAAYMRNEGTLVALRQLQEQIVLDYVSSVDKSCQPRDGTGISDVKLARWVTTLITLQPGTLTAPVLIPVASTSQVGNTPPNESKTSPPLPNRDEQAGRGQANGSATQVDQTSPIQKRGE